MVSFANWPNDSGNSDTLFSSSLSTSKLCRCPKFDGRSSRKFIDSIQVLRDDRRPKEAGNSLSLFWPVKVRMALFVSLYFNVMQRKYIKISTTQCDNSMQDKSRTYVQPKNFTQSRKNPYEPGLWTKPPGTRVHAAYTQCTCYHILSLEGYSVLFPFWKSYLVCFWPVIAHPGCEC